MSLFEKSLLIGLVWAIPPGLITCLLLADDKVEESARAATVAITVFTLSTLVGASLTILNK